MLRDTLDKVWADVIGKSATIKTYAEKNGALFAPSAGDAALEGGHARDPGHGWLLHDSGKSKVAPDTVGIPRPDRTT